MLTTFKTKIELENNDNGFAFFGTARSKLGGQQATQAYNAAVDYLMGQFETTTMNEIYAFLGSKAGRWWAECLNDTHNYHDSAVAKLQVAAAMKATKMNLAKERASLAATTEK